MKPILLTALLAMMPFLAFAHGAPPAAAHGGVVVEASDESWVELVLKSTEMAIYVSDHSNQPITGDRLSGKATVLIGGKAQQVVLTPTSANGLAARLDPAVVGKVTSVIMLIIDGKSTQARFSMHQE